MKLFISLLLVLATGSAHAQVSPSSTPAASGGLGLSEAQQFRDRFKTESPQLPESTSPSTTESSTSDSGSAGGPNSTGWSGESSIDMSKSVRGSNSESHSIGSSGDDYTIEYDPVSSNGSVSSNSAIGMLSCDDTTASSTLDKGSDGMRSRPMPLRVPLALIVMTVVALV
ncbi:hypothetical protein JG688_00004486 [Phytophthora aleatoria]|uniref:RxLR effector protein n=1 Tax=Phytophthora aleatoria TaxID=2496075 RepID=A0A8J5J3A5_9STRA|nr:hypothetical protein JG688_00004486 [Phytophthora aleatoria]